MVPLYFTVKKPPLRIGEQRREFQSFNGDNRTGLLLFRTGSSGAMFHRRPLPVSHPMTDSLKESLPLKLSFNAFNQVLNGLY